MFYNFIYLAKGFRMRPMVRSTLSDFDVLWRNVLWRWLQSFNNVGYHVRWILKEQTCKSKNHKI